MVGAVELAATAGSRTSRQHPDAGAGQDPLRLPRRCSCSRCSSPRTSSSERWLSPIGLLLLCATLAVIGLRMVSGIDNFAGAMIGAGGLRDRQDVLLADDAARGRGRSATHECGGDVDHRGHRHDVGRPARRVSATRRIASPPTTCRRRRLRDLRKRARAPTPGRFPVLQGGARPRRHAKLSDAQTAPTRPPEQQTIAEASIIGDRETLKAFASSR